MMKIVMVLMWNAIFSLASEKHSPPNPKIKYSSAKQIDFEALLIQGELNREDLSVVAGNEGEKRDSLFKVREDFLDRMAVQLGEVIP